MDIEEAAGTCTVHAYNVHMYVCVCYGWKIFPCLEHHKLRLQKNPNLYHAVVDMYEQC